MDALNAASREQGKSCVNCMVCGWFSVPRDPCVEELLLSKVGESKEREVTPDRGGGGVGGLEAPGMSKGPNSCHCHTGVSPV